MKQNINPEISKIIKLQDGDVVNIKLLRRMAKEKQLIEEKELRNKDKWVKPFANLQLKKAA